MRKFFSFMSTSFGNASDCNPLNNIDSDKIYWEKPWQSDAEDTEEDSPRTPKGRVPKHPRRSSEKGSASSCLRRSMSFSSPAFHSESEGASIKSLVDLNGSPSRHSSSLHAPEYAIRSRSLNPEKLPKTKSHDLVAVRKTFSSEKINSSRQYKDHHDSLGRTAHITQISDENNIWDLYIDGEQQAREFNNHRVSSNIVNNCCLTENKTLINSGKPPRAHSTAPSSPTCSKENLKLHSSRDLKDFQHPVFVDSWSKGDFLQTSPHKTRKKIAQKLPHAPTGRSKIKPCGYDSEITTTTVEDIYEDTSNCQHRFSHDGAAQTHYLSYQSCPSNLVNAFSTKSVLDSDSQKHSSSFGDSWCIKYEDDLENDFKLKLKEVKERLMELADFDNETEKTQNGKMPISSLLKVIRDIKGDRRYLARELLTQMHCRITERSSAREALSKAQHDLDTRTRRLEKEKNELQCALERELDQRANDWSLKLEIFKEEDQRLRERVRELAEQNVSFQKEISSLSGRETDSNNRILHLEMQLNDLTERLDESKAENQNLCQTVLELRKCSNTAETERDYFKESYNEKEKENKELEKVIVRLQRICNENEMTIAGLREGCSSKVGKLSTDENDLVKFLQLEQCRLTGVEQALRRDIDVCRHELQSLRCENVYLLDRIKKTRNVFGISMIRLEYELQTRVECLQNQGLSLLRDNGELCSKLIELVKNLQIKRGQEINAISDEYYIIEYNMKFQSLVRGFENLERSLRTVSAVLDENTHLEAFECQSQESGSYLTKQEKREALEFDFKLEFKAEALLTRVLREKLFSTELELERLRGELSSSIRSQEVLRSKIQQLQDDLSSLAHNAKDMKLEIQRKDENFNQLERDMVECSKKLAIAKGILPKVSRERDCLWDEVKHSKETDMLLRYEVSSLKKKIESLEEDVLIKEGQITILRDKSRKQII